MLFDKIKKAIGLLGKIFALFGIIGFLLIVLIGLILYGEVFLYDGFDFTAILCTICLITMLLGTVLLAIDFFLRKEQILAKQKSLIFLICVVVLSLSFSTVLIADIVKTKAEESSSESSYEMTHNTYSYIYLKVSNVSVTHSGNYAYISGTVTNNGTYQIKYVKVKAVCKDFLGKVVDTDWTYAVDSAWLSPGESKSFEMMVKDTDRKIRTADVSILPS